MAFDYQFGATEDENDPLATALSSVMSVLIVWRPYEFWCELTQNSPQISFPSKAAMFIYGLLELLPRFPMQLFMRHAPIRGLRNSRRVTRMAVGVAKELVDEKAEALIAGKGKRDIMSLLGARWGVSCVAELTPAVF